MFREKRDYVQAGLWTPECTVEHGESRETGRLAPSPFRPKSKSFRPKSESFRPKSKSFRPNFKVVSFKVICDVFTNYNNNLLRYFQSNT